MEQAREYRFRAWLTKAKIMLEGVAVYDSGMIGISDDELSAAARAAGLEVDDYAIVRRGDDAKDESDVILQNILPGDDWYWIENDFILMQYIERKDGSGTDIYHGDLVEYKWRRGKTKSGVCVAEVIWKKNMWTLSKNETVYHDHALLGVSIHFKVVGNIYTNPELLQQSTT